MSSRKIDERILFQCGDFLSQNNLKLICAESMTAGFLSSTWALEVSSGNYHLGSIVCYDNEIKENLLNVSPHLIEEHTAESAEVTLAMLLGLIKLVPHADVHVAITGLAFESPNPKQTRPVGRVYYAFSYNGMQTVIERQFKGNAGQIIIATCNNIFTDLYEWLKKINQSYKH